MSKNTKYDRLIIDCGDFFIYQPYIPMYINDKKQTHLNHIIPIGHQRKNGSWHKMKCRNTECPDQAKDGSSCNKIDYISGGRTCFNRINIDFDDIYDLLAIVSEKLDKNMFTKDSNGDRVCLRQSCEDFDVREPNNCCQYFDISKCDMI